MRVLFAGTPPFAAEALEAIVAAGHEVPLVLTQPDRPAGRGLKTVRSAVGEVAGRLGLEIAQPTSLREPVAVEQLRIARGDVMVVAAYGLLLPAAILDLPRRGCLNIHASLLPRWRGAAPIQRAILAGDAVTGVTIMRMDEGLDTGPMLLKVPVPIDERDTTGTLTAKLARAGATAITEALAGLEGLHETPQDPAGATYAAKIAKAEAKLDWSASSVELDRRVRAFNPSPGAEATIHGETLKIWEAERVSASGPPGSILSAEGDEFVVACGEGALRLRVLQRPGGRRLGAAEFLRGRPFEAKIAVGAKNVNH